MSDLRWSHSCQRWNFWDRLPPMVSWASCPTPPEGSAPSCCPVTFSTVPTARRVCCRSRGTSHSGQGNVEGDGGKEGALRSEHPRGTTGGIVTNVKAGRALPAPLGIRCPFLSLTPQLREHTRLPHTCALCPAGPPHRQPSASRPQRHSAHVAEAAPLGQAAPCVLSPLGQRRGQMESIIFPRGPG